MDDQFGPISPDLIRACEERGWTFPRAVQAESIPKITGGSDVMIASETGSGKTGAVVLPILHNMSEVLQGSTNSLETAPTVPYIEWQGDNHSADWYNKDGDQNNNNDWSIEYNHSTPSLSNSIPYDTTSSLYKCITPSTHHHNNVTIQRYNQGMIYPQWSGIRASYGLAHGYTYFEVTLDISTLTRIGLVTNSGNVDDIGNDSNSFGYGSTGRIAYGQVFAELSPIGVHTIHTDGSLHSIQPNDNNDPTTTTTTPTTHHNTTNKQKQYSSQYNYCSFHTGDIIGFAIDYTYNIVDIYKISQSSLYHIASLKNMLYENVEYYPAISSRAHVKAHFNFSGPFINPYPYTSLYPRHTLSHHSIRPYFDLVRESHICPLYPALTSKTLQQPQQQKNGEDISMNDDTNIMDTTHTNTILTSNSTTPPPSSYPSTLVNQYDTTYILYILYPSLCKYMNTLLDSPATATTTTTTTTTTPTPLLTPQSLLSSFYHDTLKGVIITATPELTSQFSTDIHDLGKYLHPPIHALGTNDAKGTRQIHQIVNDTYAEYNASIRTMLNIVPSIDQQQDIVQTTTDKPTKQKKKQVNNNTTNTTRSLSMCDLVVGTLGSLQSLFHCSAAIRSAAQSNTTHETRMKALQQQQNQQRKKNDNINVSLDTDNIDLLSSTAATTTATTTLPTFNNVNNPNIHIKAYFNEKMNPLPSNVSPYPSDISYTCPSSSSSSVTYQPSNIPNLSQCLFFALDEADGYAVQGSYQYIYLIYQRILRDKDMMLYIVRHCYLFFRQIEYIYTTQQQLRQNTTNIELNALYNSISSSIFRVTRPQTIMTSATLDTQAIGTLLPLTRHPESVHLRDRYELSNTLAHAVIFVKGKRVFVQYNPNLYNIRHYLPHSSISTNPTTITATATATTPRISHISDISTTQYNFDIFPDQYLDNIHLYTYPVTQHEAITYAHTLHKQKQQQQNGDDNNNTTQNDDNNNNTNWLSDPTKLEWLSSYGAKQSKLSIIRQLLQQWFPYPCFRISSDDQTDSSYQYPNKILFFVRTNNDAIRLASFISYLIDNGDIYIPEEHQRQQQQQDIKNSTGIENGITTTDGGGQKNKRTKNNNGGTTKGVTFSGHSTYNTSYVGTLITKGQSIEQRDILCKRFASTPANQTVTSPSSPSPSSLRFLISVDSAARGLNLDVPIVINVNVPDHPEIYVQRCGRTARNGTPGLALTLVNTDIEYVWMHNSTNAQKSKQNGGTNTSGSGTGTGASSGGGHNDDICEKNPNGSSHCIIQHNEMVLYDNICDKLSTRIVTSPTIIPHVYYMYINKLASFNKHIDTTCMNDGSSSSTSTSTSSSSIPSSSSTSTSTSSSIHVVSPSSAQDIHYYNNNPSYMDYISLIKYIKDQSNNMNHNKMTNIVDLYRGRRSMVLAQNTVLKQMQYATQASFYMLLQDDILSKY